jgi:hypothetical protein
MHRLNELNPRQLFCVLLIGLAFLSFFVYESHVRNILVIESYEYETLSDENIADENVSDENIGKFITTLIFETVISEQNA